MSHTHFSFGGRGEVALQQFAGALDRGLSGIVVRCLRPRAACLGSRARA
jgi:hypothetical protein